MTTIKKDEATMTSEEMLERRSSWTLACDNALLNRLKAFSENLSKNSHEVMKECDTLTKDVSNLDYKLRNVTNEFLMMSNTKFVENRVEDFEEIAASVTPSANISVKSKSEAEAELISKMKQAIQQGLKACDTNRVVEEEPNPEKAYRSKRPFLIGSPKFFSSKYCGLVDESRKVVPFDSLSTSDSVSLSASHSGDILQPEITNKPVVTFTMPPTPAVPILPNVPEIGPADRMGNLKPENKYMGGGVVPQSPTISDQSSDFGKPGSSNASISRENGPRSVTDELNKIYGAFSPPNAEEDSDDDFRPSASAGRIFDDDDDDLFGEKELFPSSLQRNSDFFGRANPSQLPTPVFSVPPPVNPVAQDHQPQQSALNSNSSNVQTLVGPSPKPNDIPNMSRIPDDSNSSSRKDVSKNEATATLPQVEVGPGRKKLPAGAVSMLSGLPPPIFNKDVLQAKATTSSAPTTNSVPPASSFLPSKQNTQINLPKESSIPKQPSTNADISGSVSSHHHNTQENVNTIWNTSQPSVISPAASSKRTEGVSQGSLRPTAADLHRASSNPANNSNKVPAKSLFFDDSSSDEDIFKSSRKQSNKQQPRSVNNQPSVIEKIVSVPSQIQQSTPSIPVANPVKSERQSSISSVKREGDKKKSAQIKKSIFDESDSEDDLFASKPIIPTSTKAKENKIGTGSNDLFKHATKKLTVPTTSSTKKSSLFGDDSDSDTDLFGNKKVSNIRASTSTKSVPVPTAQASISVNSKPNMEEIIEDISTTANLSVRRSSTKESVNVESLPILNNNDETVANKDEVDQQQSEKSSDIFSNSDKVEDIKKESKSSSTNKKQKSIFGDSDSSDDDLFSSKKRIKVNKNKSIKDDKIDEDNNDSDSLFSNISQKHNSTSGKSKASTTITTNEKPKKVSLFGDDSDSDSDIFSSKNKKNVMATSKASENIRKGDDDDIFSTAEHGETNSAEQVTVQKASISSEPKKGDIFTTDDSDDIFTKSKTKEIPKVVGNIEKSNSILENAKADESSNKPTKTVGNKISEKIKAMQTGQSEGSSKTAEKEKDTAPKKSIKSSVSVKNLALNLKINPLALKVGAKPPKAPGSGSTPTTPEKEVPVPSSPSGNDDNSPLFSVTGSTNPNPTSVNTTTDDTTKTSTTEGIDKRSPSISPKEELDIEEILRDKVQKSNEETDVVDNTTSSSFHNGMDHFVAIIKARVKIQQKRRPPSKKFLKTQLAVPQESEKEELANDNKVSEEKDEQSDSEATT